VFFVEKFIAHGFFDHQSGILHSGKLT